MDDALSSDLDHSTKSALTPSILAYAPSLLIPAAAQQLRPWRNHNSRARNHPYAPPAEAHPSRCSGFLLLLDHGSISWHILDQKRGGGGAATARGGSIDERTARGPLARPEHGRPGTAQARHGPEVTGPGPSTARAPGRAWAASSACRAARHGPPKRPRPGPARPLQRSACPSRPPPRLPTVGSERAAAAQAARLPAPAQNDAPRPQPYMTPPAPLPHP